VTWLALAALALVAVSAGASASSPPGPVRREPFGGRLLAVAPTRRSKAGMRDGKRHMGLDLFVPGGTPVYSPLAGTVIAADPDGFRQGYGRTVIVQHADGIATLYAHLRSIDVSKGQSVEPGTQLGTVGQSNSSSTPMKSKPHLHFEVLKPPFGRYKTKYPVVNRNRPTRLTPTAWLQERGLREH